MRLNNKSVLLAALLAGGCSSGWWRDPPAAAPAPAVPASDIEYGATQSGYPGQDVQYQAGAEPINQGDAGATYALPPRPDRQPKRRVDQPPVAEPDYAPPAQQSLRYDHVGYAVWSSAAGTVAGAHATLPPGSFVEVTALDTGRTILVPITATSRPGQEIELSGAAAQELGLGQAGGRAGVRVRATNATGTDIVALKVGRPAPPRPDTPPVLLNALRHKLSGTQGQGGSMSDKASTQHVPAPVRDMPKATVQPTRSPVSRPLAAATPRPTANVSYYVQVAAIVDQQRALSIAQQLGGAVTNAGGQYRVRFGPFDDLRTAQAARDDVAGRGYAEARIVRQD